MLRASVAVRMGMAVAGAKLEILVELLLRLSEGEPDVEELPAVAVTGGLSRKLGRFVFPAFRMDRISRS